MNWLWTLSRCWVSSTFKLSRDPNNWCEISNLVKQRLACNTIHQVKNNNNKKTKQSTIVHEQLIKNLEDHMLNSSAELMLCQIFWSPISWLMNILYKLKSMTLGSVNRANQNSNTKWGQKKYKGITYSQFLTYLQKEKKDFVVKLYI